MEHEAAANCELVTTWELFGHSVYGIGLQKGSPWMDAITLARRNSMMSSILLSFACGFMESSDKEWILHGRKLQIRWVERI